LLLFVKTLSPLTLARVFNGEHTDTDPDPDPDLNVHST
jgi:hypothetical protein